MAKKKTFAIAYRKGAGGINVPFIFGFKTRTDAEKVAKSKSYLWHHDGAWEKYYIIVEELTNEV